MTDDRRRRHGLRRAARLAAATASAVLLAVVAVPQAAVGEASLEVAVQPEISGNSAVRSGQAIVVSGQAPAGGITGATLVAVEDDGNEVLQPLDSSVLGQPSTRPQYLRSDDGAVTGRLVLDCVFAQPAPGCPTPHGPVVGLRLELVSGDQRAVSQLLPVDYLRPSIVGYRVVDPDTVEARFDEPVRGDDSAADWSVTDPGGLVRDVRVGQDDCTYLPAGDRRQSRSGCTRLLDLVLPLAEDSTPVVDYVPAANRPLYVDDAGNATDRSTDTTATRSRAVDAVRPALPTVVSVEGRAPSGDEPSTAGRATAPVVTVSGVTAGHQVVVEHRAPGGMTTAGPSAVAESETVDAFAPELGEDGDKHLLVVVTDTEGNRSDAAELQPARADGGPSAVIYRLDTVAPFLLGALAEEDGSLLVTVSESVTGSEDRGGWRLESATGTPREVTSVSGSGASRTLTVEGGAVPGDRLSYQPTSGRYADRAGNEVADDQLVVAGLAAPVVRDPLTETYTQATTWPVAGTADARTVVEVHRDADDDGRPDEVVATAPVDGDGAWSADVPLRTDVRNTLLVQARDGEARSPFAAVPPLVQDATDPALSVLAPTGGAVLPGGRTTEVRWSTSDRNAGPDATVTVALSTDGTTYGPVTPSAAGDGAQSVLLPQVDTQSARVRLSTTDLAGRTTTVTSEAFSIDATTPAFVARTVAPRTVRVEFSEPVSGPTGPDWRVAGAPATVESVDGRQGQLSADRATVLVLATTADFDPDALPEVVYTPTAPDVTGQLVDPAGQPIDPSMRRVVASDGIRPAAPTVTAVEDREPQGGEVLANDPQPTLAVSGVRAGNTVVVERATGGEPAVGGAVEASGSTAEVTAARIPADGPHLLRAVAYDPSGNCSCNRELTGPGEDGDAEVVYRLDTVAPALTRALPEGDAVRVDLSEAVTGPNAAGDWVFTTAAGDGATVTSVTGSGTSRLVEVDGGVAAGGALAYRPAGDRYVDAAGNPVADRSLVVGGVPVPVVLTPSTELVTNDDRVVVTGTGEPGDTVELLRDGAVVGRGTVDDDGDWDASAELVRDAENRLQARAVDPGTGDTSAAVDVPPIVHDATPPSLELREPTGGELLRGGADGLVRWSTADANPSASAMRVELTLDGSSWTVLAAGEAPGDDEGSLEWKVPAVSTDAAKVRVTATDLAGNRRAVTSGAFTIDALVPRYSAKTVDEREVLVRFTEPVDGTFAPGDFTVDGSPAVAESGELRAASAVRASGLREITLRTATTIGPNDTPVVAYTANPAGPATDAAGNPLTGPAVAVDGIVPVAPSITTPDDTVYERSTRRTFAGGSEVGTHVQLYAEDGSAASGAARTAADGTWKAVGTLRRDARVQLRAAAVDEAGNRSPLTTAPVVVQDSTAPQIEVGGVEQGQRYPEDTELEIRWNARDANLVDDSVVVEVTTDGGQRWERLGDELPARGSLTWRTPGEPTSSAAVRVLASDLAGNTGARSEGFFGVGRAATAAPGPANQGQSPSAGGDAGADDVDAVLSVRDRVRGALPRTGEDLLDVVLFGLVALLTGAGFLVAARDHRRSRRRRSA